MAYSGRCLIVGAGEFREQGINIEPGDLVIAADGGLQYLWNLEIVPDIVIGDMDSLVQMDLIDKVEKKGIETIYLPKMKDDTDMLAAIKVGLEKGYHSFWLYGSTGGRIDHSIANVQCLAYLKNQGAHGLIVTPTQYVEVIKNEKKDFSSDHRGYFSVFSVGQKADHVTEKGFLYEVTNVTINGDCPIGVSNEFIGADSYVEVGDGMLLLCYQRESD